MVLRLILEYTVGARTGNCKQFVLSQHCPVNVSAVKDTIVAITALSETALIMLLIFMETLVPASVLSNT
jgi:hypothetical protein